MTKKRMFHYKGIVSMCNSSKLRIHALESHFI
jgi:hypothetical protein